MFNTATIFDLKLLKDGELKTLSVRFPTDDELAARARKLITVYRGGQGDLKNQGEVEQDFLAKLRQQGDSAGEISEGEAKYASGKLLSVEVFDVERVGSAFRITLNVPKGQVVHVLGIPSIDAGQKYEKASIVREVKRNRVETYDSLSGVAAFWESIGGKVEGYAEGSGVPLNHKQAAIAELIVQMNIAMDEPDPEV